MTWLAQGAAAFWPLLLNHLWQATLFASMVAFVVWMLRSGRAQARYLVLLIAMLRFVLPAGLVTWAVDSAGLSTGLGLSDLEFGAIALPAADFKAAVVDPIVSPLASLSTAEGGQEVFYLVLSVIWTLGVAFIVVRSMWRKRALHTVVRSAQPVTSGPLAEALRCASDRLKVHIAKAVVSDSIAQPGVEGVWRPVLLLPAGIEQDLTASELEAVLAHELLHVRRRDNLASYLQASICATFWFHPLIWWLDRRLLAEREAACDEGVMDVGASARDYVSGVLKVCRFSLEAPVAGVSRMSESRLRSRMERVMSIKSSRFGWRERGAVALVTAAAVISWLVVGWMGTTSLKAADEGNKYEQWLRKDVVYIITPAEKALFEQVETDQQRDALMQKFWRDRDPTPGTPENEFREEHYRRIAYANTRWGTGASTPGWRTDRGRILIVHGPPDEIEVHPTEGHERWRYNTGVLENVILDFLNYEEAQRQSNPQGQAAPNRRTKEGEIAGSKRGVEAGARSGSVRGTKEAAAKDLKQVIRAGVIDGVGQGVGVGVREGVGAGVRLGIRDAGETK